MMSYAWSTSSLLVGTAADNRSTGLPVRLASRSNASRNNYKKYPQKIHKYWIKDLLCFIMPKMLTTSGYNFIIIKNSTLTSLAKFSLSSGLPPRRVGYSQSKSKPSKSYFRRKSMAELTKSSRLSVEATIDENAPLPAFHPPTASRVFISRFLFLILLNLSYLLKTNYTYPKN